MMMLNNYRILLALLFFFLVLLLFNFLKTDSGPKIANNNSIPPNKEETAIIDLHKRLSQHEWKVFSQNREDGVIYQLIELLDLTFENFGKNFFVEIGTQSGVECNSRFLREKLRWNGIMIDGGFENSNINLFKEMVKYSNIVGLLQKHQVPIELELLSEDTDYADYWIVEAILTKYRPKIVVHEVNQQGPERCVTVPKPANLTFWDGRNFHGASVCAFYCLAKRFDYTMVYCESTGINCFWIRNDLLKSKLKINPKKAQNFLNPKYLYRTRSTMYQNTENVWENVSC